MTRLHPFITDALEAQQQLLDAAQARLGVAPDFLRAFANSPVALRSFPGLFGIAGAGALDAAERERIGKASQVGIDPTVPLQVTA